MRTKLEFEKGIAKTRRLTELFFKEPVTSAMHQWIENYNEARKSSKQFTTDDPLVVDARKILIAMRDEIKGKIVL
jgi:hypothetical protein